MGNVIGAEIIRRRIGGISIGALVVLVVAVLGGFGWIGSERAIHPRIAHYAKSLADFPDLHPQQVMIDSRTHTRIAASSFPGTKHAIIVLTHGYGDNQVQMLPWAEFLHKAGYSVLTWDMRNRGHSAGDAVTLGALEYLDLMSVVDYLSSRPDVDRQRIGALGVSLGGATTLLAAGNDSRIKAAVDASGFATARDVIDSSFEHFIGLPPFPFSPVTAEFAALRAGADLREVRPVDAVPRINPRSLLIIQGMEDTVVPPINSERNFAAAREPKQFWRLPKGGHIAAQTVAPEEYERRVTDFFNTSLD